MQKLASLRRLAVSSMAAVAFVVALASVVDTRPADAAPPVPQAAAADAGAAQIAEAIRKRVKSQGRDKTAAEMMKMFGLNVSDPASAYMADAKVLDGLRNRAPLPALPAAKQAQTLAELYVASRMEGKGVAGVEAKLGEVMEYARGEKPLHELNLPPSERGRKKTCPHGACTEEFSRKGQVMLGGKNYDQYLCPAGHETLLRVN